MAHLVQISVSAGGVPKHPVPAVRVGWLGLEGDAQRDTRHHGGPDRAVCLFALERIEALRAEGHPIEPGSLGENLTVAGLDWETVAPGDGLRVGEGVLLEVTGYAAPCRTLGAVFRSGAYGRVSERSHPGWSRVYARVLVPGEIRRGDPVVRVARAELPGRLPASPAVAP